MIPTYNEIDNISALIHEIFALDLDISIVIIDDNSQDGTAEVIDQLSQKYKKLYPIHRLHEKGRASAGIRGFQEILKLDVEYIIEMDADFSHDPKVIPQMLQEANFNDMIIGSRYIEGGSFVNSTFWGYYRSILINFTSSVLFNMHSIKDSSSGFKCYQRHVIEKINWNDFQSTDYTIGLEILLRARNNDFKIKEIPIKFINRSKGSSKADWKVIFNYPWTLLIIRWICFWKKLK